MVLSCQNFSENLSQFSTRSGMSSYHLPMRPTVPSRTDDIHNNAEGAAYMDHFLNIPDICPPGSDYRSRGYYMGSYPEACRMEALQSHHRNHDFSRMSLAGARTSYFQNMNVPGSLRFRESVSESISTAATTNNNKNEPISPCSTGTPTTGEGETPPSFYPWMSIVGKQSNTLHLCVYMYFFLLILSCMEYYGERQVKFMATILYFSLSDSDPHKHVRTTIILCQQLSDIIKSLFHIFWCFISCLAHLFTGFIEHFFYIQFYIYSNNKKPHHCNFMCILCLFYFSEENQCKNLFSSPKYRLQSVNNFAFCDCNLLTEKKFKKFVSELKQNYNLIYDP